MGVLPNNGILSYKYLNAKIKDAGGRIRFVQVKNYLGDYFVTTINQKPYVFKVNAADIGIYDEFGVKKYRIIDYSTKHYRPISDKTDKIKELLEKNGLPKINMALFGVLKNLGKREKHGFEKHEIHKLLDELIETQHSKMGSFLSKDAKYQEASAQVIDFLRSLDTTEIVTPTREISEYIEEDLIATDPGFYGTVITTQQRTDLEHKKITNTPVGAKRPFGILLAIVFGLMLAGVGIYLLYDNGSLDGIMSMLPSMPAPSPVAGNNIMDQYPTPELLKEAVNNGEVNYNTLPPDIKAMIDQ